MSKNTYLTGITPSGIPHIGNYVGAIRPAIAAQTQGHNSLYFVADYHSLIKLHDASLRQQYILEIAASWLACGLDPDKTIFYLQSHIPEILELNWLLTTVTAKGLLNRAHAYKDAVAKNVEQDNKDADASVDAGLYCYPILMTADIVGFDATHVPVGKDQIQHVEMGRDIVKRFNHIYGDSFVLPEAVVSESTKTLPGLDGRKMSKSYDNTIPLFSTEKKLRKAIMKIKTNSQLPEEPKSTEGCALFQIYCAFSTVAEQADIATRYAAGGLGWGDMKQTLFEKINAEVAPFRDKYDALMANPDSIMDALDAGATKARAIIGPVLAKAKQHAGLM